MIVTFYNEGGLITSTGDISPQTFDVMAANGQLMLVDIEGDPLTQYVQDGELFQYTEEEIQARANMKWGWRWQMPQKVAVDLRVLEETKLQTLDWINTERDRLIASFDRFTYNGNLFDGNAAAETNINVAHDGASMNIPLPDGFTWRLFDNTDIPFTNEDIIAMKKAFLEASNLNRYTRHGMARYLKDLVPTVQTTAELDAIKNIPWPEPAASP